MKICAFHIGHDCSVCIFDGPNLSYYKMAERVSRVKHSETIDVLIPPIQNQYFDTIIVSYYADDGIVSSWAKQNLHQTVAAISELLQFDSIKVIQHEHHVNHIFSGMYSVGLEDATVIVMDGGGSRFNLLEQSRQIETESVFDVTKNKVTVLHKKFQNVSNKLVDYYKNTDAQWHKSADELYQKSRELFPNDLSYGNFVISCDPSEAGKFLLCSSDCGFGFWGAGKVMGLAQYKGYEHSLEPEWVKYVDDCHNTQRKSEERALELLNLAVEMGSHKDIILSGGYALNCVANYKLVSSLPEGYNLHIDPICFDAGQSVGAAYKEYTQSIEYIKTQLPSIYIGDTKSYFLHEKTNYADYDDIVDLLVDGKIVSIFQGNSEAGQRALGNRSILFDPRMVDGKSLVNKIKRRESFRPFGATIIEEKSNEWFYMGELKTSPYMQFAIPIKRKEIPAVTHVDGTCRIQTVNAEQNLHLYNLIKKFYERTGVPILGNTSFNLAGDPLVETIDDALKTFYNSKNDGLYCIFFPESNEILM
jgi:predicted NodU family carbamoyl transferase